MSLPRFAQPTLRRGALFLIAIGVPLCVGVVLREPAGALLGCICGLLFSFADDDQRLRRRFVALGLAAVGLGAGGVAGILLHGFAWPVWPLFVGAVFATGQLNRFGRAPVTAARFFAMALVVTSGAPELSLATAWYPLLAFVTAAVARLVDHVLFGPMSAPPAAARSAPLGGWTRFALAYAAAAAVSLWIGISIDPSRALWVVVTTLMVMQSDARTSYVRIVQRVTGTVLGVAAAFALTIWLSAPWLIALAILLIAPLIPHHLQQRYWLHTMLIAILVLLAYHLAAADLRIMRGLFSERLEDVLLGAGIALIGTMIAFPRMPVAKA